jgi:hypothetical protein
MYVYVAFVPECCGSVCCASQLQWEAQTEPQLSSTHATLTRSLLMSYIYHVLRRYPPHGVC